MKRQTNCKIHVPFIFTLKSDLSVIVTIDPCMGSNVTHKIEMKNVRFQKNYLTKLLNTIIKRLR